MDQESNSSFYVTLPSNTGKANNKTGNFTVRLASAIHLNKNWEVALAELTYPHTLKNISNKTESATGRQLTSVHILHDNGLFSYDIAEANYESGEDLSFALNDGMKHATYEKDSGKYKFSLEDSLNFKYNSTTRKMKVLVKNKRIKTIVFTQHLAYMLGFRSHYVDVNGESTESNYMLDLTGGVNTMYIYSNIVKPQFVGDTLAPLLRTVPITGTGGTVIRESFVTRQYVDVLIKDFSFITITIKTDANEPVGFDYGKCILVLHFRRKKQYLV